MDLGNLRHSPLPSSVREAENLMSSTGTRNCANVFLYSSDFISKTSDRENDNTFDNFSVDIENSVNLKNLNTRT